MIQKVRRYMRENCMVKQGEQIVVGLSGGADSVALLCVLKEMEKEYALSLYGVHIHHGIRKEADADAAYSKMLCEKFQIPFFLYEAHIPAMAKENGFTEEEMGRRYRYQCFEEVMNRVGADTLAVAHHMDDQAETMLFHLIRGSRIAGMEGMHPVSRLWLEDGVGKVSGNADKRIIRPLLCCRKKELVDWLQGRAITWQEDATNLEDVYARNCIRNQVLPVLERVNQQAVEHIAEFGVAMTGYQNFFQKAVDDYMEQEVVCGENGDLSVNREKLSLQERILQKAVVYEMLVKVCGCKKDIGDVHVQSVCDLLLKQSGKRIVLPYDMEAESSYETLRIGKRLQERTTAFEVAISESRLWEKKEQGLEIALYENQRLRLYLYRREDYREEKWLEMVKEAINSKNNYTKFFDYDTIKDTLCVRSVRQKDSFSMNEKGDCKKVSRYFIDEKIPVAQREKIPVLANRDKVLWIVGRRRGEDGKVSLRSKRILKVVYEGE